MAVVGWVNLVRLGVVVLGLEWGADEVEIYKFVSVR